ncbi:MAG: hypothetical protein MSIBF_04515 [Candidatus Altiarchaeales archaeon IMC4]|nr:MAG: hypothetical protein MSIBF_04515 [Candidatus Altiarchaeales archaeon IMC4]
MNIDDYTERVRAGFEEILSDIERDDSATIKKISSKFKQACIDYPMRGGKFMRPMIVGYACDAVGGDIKKSVPAALAVELIHNFSLVHDDIMDNDETRRGMPSLHVIHGVGYAILAGDILMTKIIDAVLKIGTNAENKEKIFHIISRALTDLSVGQALDTGFENENDVNVEEYISMIIGKTARLFEASSELGAVIGGGSEKEVNALRDYGLNLGICFQMVDDCLGLIGDPKVTGKPVGSDINERKKSYPILAALAGINEKRRKEIRKRMYVDYRGKDLPQGVIEEMNAIIKETCAVEKTRDVAKQYMEKARRSLIILPESESKNALLEIAKNAYDRVA